MKPQVTRPQPPRWATRLLQWYCAPHLLEEIEGDLQEEFDFQVRHAGIRKARIDYARSVLGFFRPFAIKRRSSSRRTTGFNAYQNNLNPTDMVRNYIVIALRLLIKNKAFSLINILGLSAGVACCILITLYIQDEFSYEKGFADHQKIFRINTTFVEDGGTGESPNTSPPIATGLAEALPEIEMATRVMNPIDAEVHIVQYNDKTFFEKRAILVDSTFLDVFQYPLVEGDPSTALDAPATLLLSHHLAKKIFGDKSALDELLIINSGSSADTFRVTGVVATPRYPSHLDRDLYMSMRSNGWGEWALSQTTWTNNNNVGGYVRLRDPETYKAVEAKFPAFVERYAGAELRQAGRQKILTLQPLDDIRLYSAHKSGSSITYIYIVGTIGIFILLLACINFMNLTTARSAQRASEVGIRKSMGAFKGNLIGQFLGESFIIVLFALVVSFALVVAALPAFNSIMQKQLDLGTDNLPFILAAALVICIVTALIAGSYPAFFLSSLKPGQVLKGKSLSGNGSHLLRKGLVVFQFVITITLISSIVIIQQQLTFMKTKPLGFDAEQLVMIPLRTPQAARQYATLKETFSQINGVKVVSATSSLPSTPLTTDWMIFKQGSSNDQSLKHEIVRVDKDYFDALNIRIIAGRDFIVEQDNLAGDTVSIAKAMVNESSLKQLGIALEDAVGTSIYFQPGDERYEFTIIGVVKDFHQFSMHRQISPMLFFLPGNRGHFNYMTASVRLDAYQNIQQEMKTIWDRQINNAPFESIFVSENVQMLYENETRTSQMLTISTVIALLISCLGLYGLSVYIAERKTKEIGIRKVVGASVESIVTMLSREYILLILISFCISVPLGYYLMSKWLEGFSYKITPGVSVFLISGAVSFLIAWLTVSYESFRAANRNPVDTFRSS